MILTGNKGPERNFYELKFKKKNRMQLNDTPNTEQSLKWLSVIFQLTFACACAYQTTQVWAFNFNLIHCLHRLSTPSKPHGLKCHMHHDDPGKDSLTG